MATADLCWAFYINRVNKGDAIAASFWGVLLFLAGSVGVINYVNDHWLLMPACLGVIFGTYTAIKIDNRKT